jgi:hypothetical protein
MAARGSRRWAIASRSWSPRPVGRGVWVASASGGWWGGRRKKARTGAVGGVVGLRCPGGGGEDQDQWPLRGPGEAREARVARVGDGEVHDHRWVWLPSRELSVSDGEIDTGVTNGSNGTGGALGNALKDPFGTLNVLKKAFGTLMINSSLQKSHTHHSLWTEVLENQAFPSTNDDHGPPSRTQEDQLGPKPPGHPAKGTGEDQPRAHSLSQAFFKTQARRPPSPGNATEPLRRARPSSSNGPGLAHAPTTSEH